MATTDEDLKKLRAENRKKKEQLRKANAAKWGQVEEDNRALVAAQIGAENVRLDAEIEAAKNAKQGRKDALTPLDHAKAQMKQAETQAKAQRDSAEAAKQAATDAATAAKNDKENN